MQIGDFFLLFYDVFELSTKVIAFTFNKKLE